MTLAETRAEAFGLLAAAVTDRAAPLRLLTLATVTPAGTPDLRMLVLRAFDAERRTLALYSDLRAAKIADLRASETVALHGWDPARRLQLRLHGHAALHAGDAVARAAWQALPPHQREPYGIVDAAGTTLADPEAVTFDAAAGFAAFAVVAIGFERLETLHLGSHGQQRRARFAWQGEALSAEWIVP